MVGFYYGLVSLVASSWGNDMSVYTVVANKIHYGSHGIVAQLDPTTA